MSKELQNNLNLKEVQDIVAYWLVKTGIFSDQTIFESFGKLEEETNEVYVELQSMDKEKLALELADVIFTCYILAIQSGIDVNSAVLAQLDKQFQRYNPYRADLLRKEGKNGKEALRELKQEYIDKLADK
jgi:phosphoribosyl-ATP pyrophosphohydrolase